MKKINGRFSKIAETENSRLSSNIYYARQIRLSFYHGRFDKKEMLRPLSK